MGSLIHLLHAAFNQNCDVFGGCGASLYEGANGIRYHSKALSMITRTGRLESIESVFQSESLPRF
jgi:hypothetical protein